MVFAIYGRALSVLLKKPLKLWGISLLNVLLGVVASLLSGAVPFVGLAVTLLLETSMVMIFLRGYRKEEVKSVQLFDCFKDWQTIKRVLCGMSWMLLWIVLWALIPVVGPVFAIIRGYRYRLTPYILVTEPEVPITEAIKVSAERTEGYKGKMFLADFLFYIAIFVTSLILVLLGRIPYVGVLFIIIYVLFTICSTILSPLFLGLVQAAFYEEIKNPSYIKKEKVRVAAPATPAGPANFCSNCGARINTDAKFCPNCGSPLN